MTDQESKDIVFNKLMASTIGITLQEWLDKTEDLDSDQVNYLTEKLSSFDDDEVKKGIVEFNSL